MVVEVDATELILSRVRVTRKMQWMAISTCFPQFSSLCQVIYRNCLIIQPTSTFPVHESERMNQGIACLTKERQPQNNVKYTCYKPSLYTLLSSLYPSAHGLFTRTAPSSSSSSSVPSRVSLTACPCVGAPPDLETCSCVEIASESSSPWLTRLRNSECLLVSRVVTCFESCRRLSVDPRAP